MPDPIIDPLADPAGSTDPTSPTDPAVEQISVPRDEFNKLTAKLDVFEKMGAGMQYSPQQQQPAQPPPSPAYKDEVKVFRAEALKLGQEIDQALAAGNPVADLLDRRDAIKEQINTLTITHEVVNPALAVGVQTIDYLSDEITRPKMKHINLVKDEYEASLNNLTPEQRMNPQMRTTLYDVAVGKNIDKVLAAQKEELLRSVAQDPSLVPGGQSGRSQAASASSNIPSVKDILGDGAAAALSSKGVTADQEFQRRGYKGGWEEYYNKFYKTEGDK